MPSLTVLYGIGQYVLAFLLGMIFYYLEADVKEKAVKKQAIDLFFSYVINFIIYIWIAKVILLLPLFIKDPLAVLPYPSDSRMFYLATLLTGIHGYIASRRHKLNVPQLIHVSIPIFLMANFMYEFMDLVFRRFTQSWSTLILAAGLLLLYLLMKKKSNLFLIGVWVLIQAIFGFYFTYTTLFGYTLSAYYFIVIFIVVIIISVKRSR